MYSAQKNYYEYVFVYILFGILLAVLITIVILCSSIVLTVLVAIINNVSTCIGGKVDINRALKMY